MNGVSEQMLKQQGALILKGARSVNEYTYQRLKLAQRVGDWADKAGPWVMVALVAVMPVAYFFLG